MTFAPGTAGNENSANGIIGLLGSNPNFSNALRNFSADWPKHCKLIDQGDLQHIRDHL